MAAKRSDFALHFQQVIWQYAITVVYPRYQGRLPMVYAYATAALELSQAVSVLGDNWVQCYDPNGFPINTWVKTDSEGATHLIFDPQVEDETPSSEQTDEGLDPTSGKVLPFFRKPKP